MQSANVILSQKLTYEEGSKSHVLSNTSCRINVSNWAVSINEQVKFSHVWLIINNKLEIKQNLHDKYHKPKRSR